MWTLWNLYDARAYRLEISRSPFFFRSCNLGNLLLKWLNRVSHWKSKSLCCFWFVSFNQKDKTLSYSLLCLDNNLYLSCLSQAFQATITLKVSRRFLFQNLVIYREMCQQWNSNTNKMHDFTADTIWGCSKLVFNLIWQQCFTKKE